MKPNKQQNRRKSMAKANSSSSKLPPLPQPPSSLHRGSLDAAPYTAIAGLPDRLRLQLRTQHSLQDANEVNLVAETFQLCGDFAHHHQRRYMNSGAIGMGSGGIGLEAGPDSITSSIRGDSIVAVKADVETARVASASHSRHSKSLSNAYATNRVWCTDLSWPCGMTNFHFVLILGVGGFLLFWIFLLLRVYLPDRYWTSKDSGNENAGIELD